MPWTWAGYFLTDAVYTPGNQYYWQIAQGSPTGATVGGGAFGDFHAKFPDGFSLAAGDTITIAVGGGAAFSTVYGYLPDLKLFEDDADDDDVPVMEYIFGDATNNSIVNRPARDRASLRPRPDRRRRNGGSLQLADRRGQGRGHRRVLLEGRELSPRRASCSTRPA